MRPGPRRPENHSLSFENHFLHLPHFLAGFFAVGFAAGVLTVFFMLITSFLSLTGFRPVYSLSSTATLRGVTVTCSDISR